MIKDFIKHQLHQRKNQIIIIVQGSLIEKHLETNSDLLGYFLTFFITQIILQFVPHLFILLQLNQQRDLNHFEVTAVITISPVIIVAVIVATVVVVVVVIVIVAASVNFATINFTTVIVAVTMIMVVVIATEVIVVVTATTARVIDWVLDFQISLLLEEDCLIAILSKF